MLNKIDNLLRGLVSKGILMIFVGSLFFYYGWTTYSQYVYLVENGQRHPGEVVHTHCPVRGPDYLYVRLDKSGREVKVEECESNSEVGDRVTLLSSEENPEEYRILERGVVLELALIPLSLGFLLLGAALLFKWWKGR
jgi:hypothetical protein